MNDKKKPSLEEVLEYAAKQASIYVRKSASSLPPEQRDEIEQDALLRCLEAYDRLDSTRGWKSYIQRHCWGAALDYIRSSAGFEESELPRTVKDPVTGEVIDLPEKKPWRLKSRLANDGISTTRDSDHGDVSVDQTLGSHGVHDIHHLFENTEPRWELIARMASQDSDIHLVGKLRLGFTQTELSGLFKVSRERLTQRFQEFCRKLDSAEQMDSRWTAQTIFAFGLCAQFNMPDRDLGFGWEYEAVHLWSIDDGYVDKVNPQMAFEFDWH